MKKLLLFIIVVAIAGGAVWYVRGSKARAEAAKPVVPAGPVVPSYETKFNAADYRGAYGELETLLKEGKADNDPTIYYMIARAAMEIGQAPDAETNAIKLLERFGGAPEGRETALKLGRDFYARFVAGVEKNRDYWMITRDLLGIGLQSNPDDTPAVVAMLDELNGVIEFSKEVVRPQLRYTVEPGDSLEKIAKKFKTNWEMIARINQIDKPSSLAAGQTIKVVPGGDLAILVIKSRFMLTVFKNGIYLKSYPVGIGKEGEDTPTGETTIANRQIRPDWTLPGKPVVRFGDPTYPLGERWMGFDKANFASYGIHGTNDEPSIGTKCSNGCVRMKNADVIEFYSYITIGTRVTIRE